MHMTIRAIVYARTYEEAINNAEEVFNRLSGEDKSFDYYNIYKKDGARADTEEGRKLILEGMERTQSILYENLAKVRHGLSQLSDEDIWMMVSKSEDEDVPALHLDSMDERLCLDAHMLRFFMGEAGQYRGSGIFIYDDDVEGIRDPKHLHRALTKWACLYQDAGKLNPYAGLDAWVIPADVHF
jgi:hypothetical protein